MQKMRVGVLRMCWGAAAVLGLPLVSGCNDQRTLLAPHPDPVVAAGHLNLPHAQEVVLSDGRLEIEPLADFDDSGILAQVKRQEEDVDGLKATTFSSSGAALTILRTPDGRPQASLLVSADGSASYKLNGREEGRLQRGVVPAPLNQRGRFLQELRRKRGAAVRNIQSDPEGNCETCIVEPTPPNEGGANADMRGAYTFHIANIDDPYYEYTQYRESNGCTSSPDGHWKACCNMHDHAYGDGGVTDEERKRADLMLYDCMVRVYAGDAAPVYYAAVRNAGSGAFNWRASYGSCFFHGSQADWVYGPGRYIHNPWGFAYRLGYYPYSDDCRSKGYT
jgi:hypothetical protein